MPRTKPWPPRKWWHDSNYLIAVTRHAYDEGEITTPREIFRVLEKPWNYDELHHLFDEWQCAAGEAQDEHNLSEP